METPIHTVSVSPWVLVASLVALVLLGLVVAWQYLRSRRMRSHLAALAQRADHAATRDALTGLMQRQGMEQALEQAMAGPHEPEVTVLYLGLDGMRTINDGFGHAQGDELLRQTARRLATACEGLALARVAGDEFAVLMREPLAEARAKALELLAVIRRPVALGKGTAEGTVMGSCITASIGLASYPVHGAPARLIANANLAMQVVKAAGGNAHADYEPAMGVDHRERVLLRRDLAEAVQRRQFELYYQPKVDARTLRITGAEALLRWNHSKRGMVSPASFIPLAEKTGLISDIGNWVIEEACRQAAAWREKGLRMRVAVNLSAYQIRQDDLVARITGALQRHGLKSGHFTCEVTESVAMEDTQVTRNTFEQLRQAGLQVSIDDFGTGHSSVASLRRLPAEELKIDRAFVSELATSADARSGAAAIVQMAHSLELRVVAEGVETEAQRDLLIGLGCDQMQGYLFAKPMSATALALWAQDDWPQVPATFSESIFKTTEQAVL